MLALTRLGCCGLLYITGDVEPGPTLLMTFGSVDWVIMPINYEKATLYYDLRVLRLSTA